MLCDARPPARPVQVRRPNNYDVNMALMLGPTDPNPTMDLSGLEIVRTVVQVGAAGRRLSRRLWRRRHYRRSGL